MFKEEIPVSQEQIFKPEEYVEKLHGILARQQQRINREFKKFSADEIVDETCTICDELKHWQKKNGGEYKKEDIKQDLRVIKDQERYFSGITDDLYGRDNEKFLAYCRSQGLENDAEIIAQYHKDREKNMGTLSERATLAIFNKILNEKYLLIGTSKFDDYEHGVDFMLIRKEDKMVACGFDGVVDRDKNSRRYEKKMNRNRILAQKNGATIKYGLSFATDKDTGNIQLKKGQVGHIPTFCLNTHEEKLKGLLRDMDYDSDEPNQAELSAFDELLTSLETQITDLKSVCTADKVKENIFSFKKSLHEIKELRAKHDK